MPIGKRKKIITETYSAEYFQADAIKRRLIPTGSTLLNCACSDNPFGGYQAGRFANPIGDRATGKTVLGLTSLATICNNSRFDGYDIFYDEAEHGLDIDLERFFGKIFVNRVEMITPASETIEDFFRNVLLKIKPGTPFVYLLDSMDSITSEAEQKRAAQRIAPSSEKKKGTYATEKPRELSEMLRVIKGNIERSGSFVNIISQTRDNLGYGAMFKPKVRSGGKALEFYVFHEMWLSSREPETREVKKKKYIIGGNVEVRISKNKVTGKRRKIYFSIFDDLGLDDVGSCTDYLTNIGEWTKTKSTIKATQFDLEGSKAKIISFIEQENREKELQVLVGKVWNEIEDSLKLDDRKRRFE